jgi:hypothetical protein
LLRCCVGGEMRSGKFSGPGLSSFLSPDGLPQKGRVVRDRATDAGTPPSVASGRAHGWHGCQTPASMLIVAAGSIINRPSADRAIPSGLRHGEAATNRAEGTETNRRVTDRPCRRVCAALGCHGRESESNSVSAPGPATHPRKRAIGNVLRAVTFQRLPSA